ncbi:MAG: S-layer homology domain-containing protein [Ruminococcaceae bacterium]|nr:S-layer homology domain-containing protein [Oscillospiraceae bacterium]
MKKLFILLCVILAVSFSISVSAATLEGDPQKSAEALKELDLFRGTDKGFELSRPMTRAEAAAMLVRFLGAEEKALNGSFSHPFTDVPGWADKYVGWLYQSGLTKGISNTLYGSQQPVTAWQYATFITRALQDYEEIPSGLITEDEINAIDSEKKFLRGDAAIMSLRALGCTYSKNGNWRPFADVCIERKLFTVEKFSEISGDFWSSTYSSDLENHIVRRVLGIEVAKTSDGGYFVFETIDPIASDGTKYDPFVYKQSGETVTIYTMNPETLKTTEFAKREGIKGHYNYKNPFKLGDTHFIFETLADEDKNTVLAVKNGEIREVLSFVNGGEFAWYPYAGENIMIDSDSVLIMTKDKYFVVTETGYTEIGQANLFPLAYLDGEIIAKRVNSDSIDVLLLDGKTGEEKVCYNIPDDMERGQYGEGFRDLDREYERYYYGEAGLYYHDGKTLVQVTSRPVNSFFRCEDGGYVISTHKPGKRFSGMNHFVGNEIMYVNNITEEEKYLTKEDTPFSIDGVFPRDGKVHFSTASDVGMQHFDVYEYRIEDNGKLTVFDFEAGRPEVMNGFSWENPTGYKARYIEAEQKRIEELGY